MLFHASVLANLDVGLMLQLLRIPATKLAGQAASAVRERITTVSAETGACHDASSLRPSIAAGFEQVFGVVLEHGLPDESELARAQVLAVDRYRSQSWLSERSVAGDADGSALLKTPAGLARIYVSTHGELVKSAMVVGDFNELPPALAAMEAALRWQRLDHKSVAAAVVASGAAEALGVEPYELAAAVIEAGRGKQERYLTEAASPAPLASGRETRRMTDATRLLEQD